MPIEPWSDTIWIVKLAGEPDLSDDLETARDRVSHADQAPHVILDFTQVRQINSSNLSQLLRLRKLAIDRDVKLRLVGLNDTLWAVFLTTGLDKVFEFLPDVPTTLATLQMEE